MRQLFAEGVMMSASLGETVKDGVLRTLEAIREHHPGETVVGYALMTDDSVSTLSYLAITREALQAAGEPDLLFRQNDWPYEDGLEALDPPDEQLRGKASAAGDDGFVQHVEQSFSELVNALFELKEGKVFGSDVFLSVISSDPGKRMDERATAAIVRLNDPALVRARQETLDGWRGRR